ncbi:hypothetical protein HOH87_00170 [bacterium]|nr:hypothetical protein [bacterium]
MIDKKLEIIILHDTIISKTKLQEIIMKKYLSLLLFTLLLSVPTLAGTISLLGVYNSTSRLGTEGSFSGGNPPSTSTWDFGDYEGVGYGIEFEDSYCGALTYQIGYIVNPKSRYSLVTTTLTQPDFDFQSATVTLEEPAVFQNDIAYFNLSYSINNSFYIYAGLNHSFPKLTNPKFSGASVFGSIDIAGNLGHQIGFGYRFTDTLTFDAAYQTVKWSGSLSAPDDGGTQRFSDDSMSSVRAGIKYGFEI